MLKANFRPAARKIHKKHRLSYDVIIHQAKKGDLRLKSYTADLIVVSYNTRKYLGDCLQSLTQYADATIPSRIWVVDNASQDGSVELIHGYGNGVSGIFNRQNQGYGSACNQGIAAGNGEYIFLLNSDIKATDGWLAPLVKTLSCSPWVAVVGPRLVNPRGLLVGVGVVGTNAHPVIRGWGEPNEPERYNQPLEVLSVCGACIGIKRSLIPRLGLFDAHYFHYFEETDYCYNARFHGYKIIYCPDSTVIHRVFGSCRDQLKLQKYFRQSEAYFNKKWKVFLKDGAHYGQTIFNCDDAGEK